MIRMVIRPAVLLLTKGRPLNGIFELFREFSGVAVAPQWH
jgi:hypothetical protein